MERWFLMSGHSPPNIYSPTLLNSIFILILTFAQFGNSVVLCPQGTSTTFVRVSRTHLTGKPIVSGPGDASTCAQYCRGNKAPGSGLSMACASFNYNGKGTCYYFSDAAAPYGGAELSSKPVAGHFYFEKICLPGVSAHQACLYRSYAFERMRSSRLEGFVKRAIQTNSREDCLSACLREQSFVCKSVTYNYDTLFCELSDQDRRTKPLYIRTAYGEPVDYFDNNCLNRQNRCGEVGGNLVFVKTPHFEMHYNDDQTIRDTSQSYCLQHCLDEGSVHCRSVEYSEEHKTCVISDEDTFSRADQQGKPHDDPEKAYYEPVCVASDLSSSTCRQQAAFTRHIGSAVQGQPIASAQKVTVADCISLCFQNLDCKSINYDRTKQGCFIYDVQRGDYAAVKTNPSVDYYEFHCESQFGGMALCTDQGIKFIVNTKEPYTGAVYAAERFATCSKVVHNARQIVMLFPPPTINTNCGTKLRNGRLEADVVVSLDGVLPHQVTTEWDRFYRVSCDTSLQGFGEGTVVVTTIFDTGDAVPQTLPLATPGPVSAQLLFIDGNNLMVTTTQIGQPLYLVVQSPQAGPNNMMLLDCTASRPEGFGLGVPFKVIDNGCPTYPALLGPVERDHAGNRLRSHMKAFRLDGSYDIMMTCVVMFCAGPNGCPPSNCLDAATYQIFQSNGRKKRDVTSNGTAEFVNMEVDSNDIDDNVEETLSAYIRVLAEGEEVEERYDSLKCQRSQNIVQVETEDGEEMMCINETSFIAIIVTISLLCILFSGVILAWGCAKLREVPPLEVVSSTPSSSGYASRVSSVVAKVRAQLSQSASSTSKPNSGVVPVLAPDRLIAHH